MRKGILQVPITFLRFNPDFEVTIGILFLRCWRSFFTILNNTWSDVCAQERIIPPYDNDSTSGFELLKYWWATKRARLKDDSSLVDDRLLCLYSYYLSRRGDSLVFKEFWFLWSRKPWGFPSLLLNNNVNHPSELLWGWVIKSVSLVIYCCITSYPTFSDLKEPFDFA